jgi:uncharacterized protein (DUF433 family)
MDEIHIINRGRGPELEGTRITVYDVYHYLEKDCTPEFIAWALNLSVPQVLALCRYIEEHRDEVLAVHRRIEERIRRGNPPEIEEKFKESRRKLLAYRDELRRRRAGPEGNGAGNPG